MDEMEITTVNEEVEENETVPAQAESNNVGKLAVGLGLVVAGGIAALVYKNRDKLKQKRIAKLEKQGYTIIEPASDKTEVDECFTTEKTEE